MNREMLKSKIHRVVVTDADLNYMGSITVDAELLEKAGILENEKVMVVNINNGARFETYAVKGKRGSGKIALNGGSARLAQVGDIIIILSFGKYNDSELKDFNPIILHVNENNEII